MFLATQAGKEYVEAFWKAKYDSIIYFVIFSKLKQRYRAQKHKPKWVTPEVIEGGITITEVEICALWAPISLACGSGWFLDENLKARMVTFVPIMKKQTYWILARFIRALTLTKETDMDLSVETRISKKNFRRDALHLQVRPIHAPHFIVRQLAPCI